MDTVTLVGDLNARIDIFKAEVERLKRLACSHAEGSAHDESCSIVRGLECENERLMDLLRRKDQDLSNARFRADEKLALRREVEVLLGVESGPAGDEQFAAGVEALRKLVAERDVAIKALVEIADGDAQTWPNCSARRVAALALGREENDVNRNEHVFA
jgi:hypothetical protein